MTRLGITDSPESTFNNNNNTNNNNTSAEANTPAEANSLRRQLRFLLKEGINMASAPVPQRPPKKLQVKVFEHLLSLYSILNWENLDKFVFDDEGSQLNHFFACCGDGRSKNTCADPLIADHIWNVLEHFLKMSRETFITKYNNTPPDNVGYKPTKSLFFGLGYENDGRVERVFNKMPNGECIC